MKWDLHPSVKEHSAQAVEPPKMMPVELPSEPEPTPSFRRKDKTTGARKDRGVFLVMDRPVIREGLTLLLRGANFLVVGQAGDGKEAFADPRLGLATVVVVDLLPGREDVFGLIKSLRARQFRCVVCSINGDAAHIRAAFAVGVSGYVTQDDEAQHLVEAIRAVVAGCYYVSPSAGAGLARKVAGLENSPLEKEFSSQQWQIYQMLGKGDSAGEIAMRIHVSPHTVESYCHQMVEKLDLRGTKALRRHAIANGNRAFA